MRRKSAALLILILSSTAGCSLIKQRLAIKQCRFSIVSVEIASFSLSSLSLDLVLEISNPNRVRAVLDRMDLDFFIEGNRAAGAAFDAVTVEPEGMETVHARVEVPYSSIGITVTEVMRKKERVGYRLSGRAYMRTALGVMRIPVTVSKN